MAAAESRSTAAVKAVLNAVSLIGGSTTDGDDKGDENVDNMVRKTFSVPNINLCCWEFITKPVIRRLREGLSTAETCQRRLEFCRQEDAV